MCNKHTALKIMKLALPVTKEELKKQYLMLAKMHHPDSAEKVKNAEE